MVSKALDFDLHFEEELQRYDNCHSYYLECLHNGYYSSYDLDLAVREFLKARQRFVDYVRSLIH